MKKITLVLVVLLAAGTVAFAQMPTAEEAADAMERLAELEAQPAITASATLSFEFGDDNTETDTPTLPVFSYAKSAKAELGLSSGDEKVQATATLDLCFRCPSRAPRWTRSPMARRWLLRPSRS